MSEFVFRLAGIVRTYRQGRKTLEVLRGCALEVREGETYDGTVVNMNHVWVHVTDDAEISNLDVFSHFHAAQTMEEHPQTLMRRKPGRQKKDR